jgi:hypothetical protein
MAENAHFSYAQSTHKEKLESGGWARSRPSKIAIRGEMIGFLLR